MQKRQLNLSQNKKELTAVCYIPLANIAVAVAYRRDSEILFHALQGLMLSAYFLLSYFVVPGFGIYLAVLILALLVSGFIQTALGQNFRIPLLADFLDSIVKVFDKNKVAL
jgi:hypothetical protein